MLQEYLQQAWETGTFLKKGRTYKNLMVASKDRDTIMLKSGVMYRYMSDRVKCDEDYIGKSARTFVERFKEHLKTPSSIYDFCNIIGHLTTVDNFSIVGREDWNLARAMKESIHIMLSSPSLIILAQTSATYLG